MATSSNVNYFMFFMLKKKLIETAAPKLKCSSNVSYENRKPYHQSIETFNLNELTKGSRL